MNYNKTNFFVNGIALFMMGAFAQSSYAGDMGENASDIGEKENKGDEQASQLKKISVDRILFGKPVEGDEVTVKVVESFSLHPDKNYYHNNTTNELNLILRPADFEGFTWSKFLGESRDDLIINSARQAAFQEFKSNRSRIEKHPGMFAALVGVASIAGTAAFSMFFNK